MSTNNALLQLRPAKASWVVSKDHCVNYVSAGGAMVASITSYLRPSSTPCRHARRQAEAALVLPMTLVPAAGRAQTPADAGFFLRETRPPEPLPAPSPPPIESRPRSKPSPLPVGSGVTVHVDRFVFSGNLALPTSALAQSVVGWTGRSVPFEEMSQAVEAIESLYRAKGYFLAQARFSCPWQVPHRDSTTCSPTRGARMAASSSPRSK